MTWLLDPTLWLVAVTLLLVVLVLWLAGGDPRRVTPRRARVLRLAALAGLLAGYLPTTPLGSTVLLRGLEYAYPPVLDVTHDLGGIDATDVRFVVVLGGGHSFSDDQVATSLLSRSSIVRLAEGARLLADLPNARLLLAGGTQGERVSEAALMSQVAESWGLPLDRIVLEDRSSDTADQAIAIAALIGDQPAILVTSASHMKRAMGLFERQGSRLIAAPTAHLSSRRLPLSFRGLIPSQSSLKRSQRAVYERVALLLE